MEAISTTKLYRSLQSFWPQTASYQRVEGLPQKSNTNKRIIKLGGGKKKRIWKVGSLKRVRVPSLRKLLLNLRDAYVSVMLAFARGGGGGLPAEAPAKRRRVPRARNSKVKSNYSVKGREFERRMMVHIYNSVVFAPREVASY